MRKAVAAGEIRRLPRGWIALPAADPALELAARSGGRLTCVTAARRLRLWIPDHAEPERAHLRVPPSSARHDAGGAVLHWSVPPAPTARYALMDPAVNVLEAIARCLPFESALAVWESAVRNGSVTVAFLRRVTWRTHAARRLAQSVGALADSGLETIFIDRLRPYGLSVRQQVWIDGHPVDALIGERLVVQADGFEHHSDAARRRADIRADARLVLFGYTVLRFDYQQIMFDWPHVESSIMGAVAQGLHLA
jgi:very-short-patch-repair endonuclease